MGRSAEELARIHAASIGRYGNERSAHLVEPYRRDVTHHAGMVHIKRADNRAEAAEGREYRLKAREELIERGDIVRFEPDRAGVTVPNNERELTWGRLVGWSGS